MWGMYPWYNPYHGFYWPPFGMAWRWRHGWSRGFGRGFWCRRLRWKWFGSPAWWMVW